MYGDVYGYEYAMLRHAELVKTAENERLAQRIEEAARSARDERPLGRRILVAAGEQLVVMGCRSMDLQLRPPWVLMGALLYSTTPFGPSHL